MTNLTALADALERAGRALHDAAQAIGATSTGPSPAPSSGHPVKSCAHGTRVRREGTSKAGKPYVAHFCPQPKDAPDTCPPAWGDD